MPSTIPYHPSLTLGAIVPEKNLDTVKKISELTLPIDNTFEKMNSLLELKRSSECTLQEMLNMNLDVSEMQEEIDTVNKSLLEASKNYMKTKITQENLIVNEKLNLSGLVNSSLESPVDFTKTDVDDSMPLSFNSLKLDARYFSYDTMNQNSHAYIAAIKNFVGGSSKTLGKKYSAEMSNSAQSQIASQLEQHNIEGTLIITATCTHKNALLLNPFVLDVDKAIRIWNTLYPDKIKINSVQSMQKIANEEGTDKERKMHIISGATCGSSLVGMVHIMKSETTESREKLLSVARNVQAKAESGLFFAKATGSMGLDTSFSADLKSLLSNQEINSHISLITMGVIPKITSSEVELGVKQFKDFNPSKTMIELAKIHNSNNGSATPLSEAEKTRQMGQMMHMQANKIDAVMSSLGKLKDGNNKILDINSLMNSFEDYINRVQDGNVGVPLNYYLKPITRAQLAQMWVTKYYPDEYLAISGDDSDKDKKTSSKNHSNSKAK